MIEEIIIRDNLEDLQVQLTRQISQLFLLISFVGFWYLLSISPIPGAILLITLLVIAFSSGGWWLVSVGKTRAARYLLLGGMMASQLFAMIMISDAWLPFTGMLIPLAGTLLGFNTAFLSTALMLVIVISLQSLGLRDYPLMGIIITMLPGAVITHFSLSTLYTALQWTSSMQHRANALLEETRVHRGELSRSLKSLKLANELLRRTQQDLIFARKQADDARKLKEQFAANISHEIRTPLNLILGFSQVMHLKPEVYKNFDWPATLRRDIYQIYRSSRHLLGMIDDILDLSRFEMTGFELNREITNIGALIEETIEIASDLFRGQSVEIVMKVEDDLPLLEIDRTRIRQVLLNLLNNAARYAPQGIVTVSAWRSSSDIIVSVRDTGPGIDPEKIPHIFEEFYQVDSSLRREQGGVGLGLTISKKFVEAHVGHIWVESQLGSGSNFQFSLPVVNQTFYANQSVHDDFVPDSRPCLILIHPDLTVGAMIRYHLPEFELIQVEYDDHLPEAISSYHPRVLIVPANRSSQVEYLAKQFNTPVVSCSLPGNSADVHLVQYTRFLTKPMPPDLITSLLFSTGEIESVLIVDDERGFVQMMERIIQSISASIQIFKAYAGREGVSAAQEYHPDLIFLDMILPDISGTQALIEMRQVEILQKTPVFLMTSANIMDYSDPPAPAPFIVYSSRGIDITDTFNLLGAVVSKLGTRLDPPI